MNNYNLLIKEILTKLEKNKIPYVINRNYDFLIKNKKHTGGDIDLCIMKKDIKKISKLFLKNNYKKLPINPFSNHLGFIKYISSEQKILFFHIHINGITGIHLKYLDYKHILTHKRKKKFFYVPSSEDEFLGILLHTIIDRTKIRKDYQAKLSELYPLLNKKYVKKHLNNTIGFENTTVVLKNIKNNNFKKIESKHNQILKYFIKHYKNKYYYLFKVYILGGFWKFLWYSKNKPLISFIGMDGSGKTTITNRIIEILKKNNLKVSRVYTGRGRNNVLPIQLFGSLYRKAGGKPNLKIRKNDKKISILQTIAAPIFALDLLLRYVFQIIPLRKKNHFTITDRYSTDILLINKVPKILKNFLFVFFPKPTLIFYLHNKPEILTKRKKHPIEDLYRQEKIFLKITEKVKSINIKSENLTIMENEIVKKIIETIK